MPTPQELEDRFWSALASDMTMMLGLNGVEDGHVRPMTAQLMNGEKGPIWFFTSKDSGIVQKLSTGRRAIATFTSKNHDLYATVHGAVMMDLDRATIDALWNRYVAAWFEGGKDDPKLVLLEKFGSTRPALSPASSFCLARTRSRRIRIARPRSTCDLRSNDECSAFCARRSGRHRPQRRRAFPQGRLPESTFQSNALIYMVEGAA